MNNQSELPPLMGSDGQTLKEDRYDSFYKKRPSEVWTGKVERIEMKTPPKCDHFFIYQDRGVRCEKCHIGLTGENLTIREGRVYYKDQKIL